MSSLITRGEFLLAVAKGFKISNQQYEGGPPWSISTQRLGVWLVQARVPPCLQPRQTTLGNRKCKSGASFLTKLPFRVVCRSLPAAFSSPSRIENMTD